MILSVQASFEEGDRDLERRVTAFLAGRNVPALRRLYVRSSQGVVTLRGHVRTFYEKQLGGTVARRVAGVVRLVDDVKVATGEKALTRGSVDRPNAGAIAAGQLLDSVSPRVKEGP